MVFCCFVVGSPATVSPFFFSASRPFVKTSILSDHRAFLRPVTWPSGPWRQYLAYTVQWLAGCTLGFPHQLILRHDTCVLLLSLGCFPVRYTRSLFPLYLQATLRHRETLRRCQLCGCLAVSVSRGGGFRFAVSFSGWAVCVFSTVWSQAGGVSVVCPPPPPQPPVLTSSLPGSSGLSGVGCALSLRQEGGWAADRWFLVCNRGDCLWSPRPQGVFFVAMLFSLVAGVAVALCRHWCVVPGVPGWHVERQEGVVATVVVLPVPGTPAVVVLPGPWVVVVVVDVPPVFVLPVGGPVVSRVSRSIRSSGSCRLESVRGASRRTPSWVCCFGAWRLSPGSPAGMQCGGRPPGSPAGVQCGGRPPGSPAGVQCGGRPLGWTSHGWHHVARRRRSYRGWWGGTGEARPPPVCCLCSTHVDLSPGAPGWVSAASLSGLLPPSALSFSALLVLLSKRPSCLTIRWTLLSLVAVWRSRFGFCRWCCFQDDACVQCQPDTIVCLVQCAVECSRLSWHTFHSLHSFIVSCVVKTLPVCQQQQKKKYIYKSQHCCGLWKFLLESHQSRACLSLLKHVVVVFF